MEKKCKHELTMSSMRDDAFVIECEMCGEILFNQEEKDKWEAKN